MYVCVCNAVTERQIHHAVKNGADTVKQLKNTLGVGADCASCASCAKACINSAKKTQGSNTSLSEMVTTKLIEISPIGMDASR